MLRRMSYDDFVTNFSLLEMCMTHPAVETLSLNPGSKIRWEITSHEGSWKKYVNAGGCSNYISMSLRHRFSTCGPRTTRGPRPSVGRGGALFESMTFNRRVVGSTPAL